MYVIVKQKMVNKLEKNIKLYIVNVTSHPNSIEFN